MSFIQLTSTKCMQATQKCVTWLIDVWAYWKCMYIENEPDAVDFNESLGAFHIFTSKFNSILIFECFYRRHQRRIQILKSQLAMKYSRVNDYQADFWEFLQVSCGIFYGSAYKKSCFSVGYTVFSGESGVISHMNDLSVMSRMNESCHI